MRSSAMINDVFAALISVFYWLQNQYVLHQTPIEINPLLEKPKRTWPQTRDPRNRTVPGYVQL